MSLDIAEELFIEELQEIWETEAEETESAEDSRVRIAQKMAAAIKKFIKAGVVTTTETSGHYCQKTPDIIYKNLFHSILIIFSVNA